MTLTGVFLFLDTLIIVVVDLISATVRRRRDDEPPFYRPPIGYGGYSPGSVYDQRPVEIYYRPSERLYESDGKGYLAWVIVAVILVCIFVGVLLYYLAFCYPVMCKKSRTVNLEIKRQIELEEKPTPAEV